MNPYPREELKYDENGAIADNIEELAKSVVGCCIVKAEQRMVDYGWRGRREALVITLDNGTEVRLKDTDDCCAYTELEAFLLHPDKVNHIILGVGTTEDATVWHIFADMGDVMELTVGWSAGSGYYGYGFDIEVVPVNH